jgi:hypothetical protein
MVDRESNPGSRPRREKTPPRGWRPRRVAPPWGRFFDARGGGMGTVIRRGGFLRARDKRCRAARVEAFLNVELFRAMYDALPPPAIERQVAQLGVSPKQTERARQTFMKSAQYAGLIDASPGRFVKPGIVSKEQDRREREAR